MGKDKETIEIDSNGVLRFTDFANDSSNRMNYLVDNSNEKFKSLKDLGLYNDGISVVEKGYTDIQNNMKEYSRILNGYYTNLSEMEKKLIGFVEGIDVPDDYKVNNSFSVRKRDNSQLEKEDGTAIKTGETLEADNLSVGENLKKENLESVVKEETGNVAAYDDSSNVNKENIGEFNNVSTIDITEEPEINLQKAILEKVNTEGNDESQDDDFFEEETDNTSRNKELIEDLIKQNYNLEQENEYEFEN